MTRLLLVGFMATGKTTLGKALAKDLGLQFIDLDYFIESRFRMTISKLFAEKGETEFREIERRMLHEVAEFEDVIVSTGGGTPCFFDNMAYMNQQGTTVQLVASEDVLFTRLTLAHNQRPLVAGKTETELRQYINEMLEKRAPFYSMARYTFDANRLEDVKQIEESVAAFKKQILF